MARNPLFSRLPAIWKRLDLPDGLLERFLGVLDSELNRVHDKTEELLDLRSVDRIPDRYLPLLGPILGHEWNSDKSYGWNRTRIRDAIRRYSYKGTLARLSDLLVEHAVIESAIQDNASRLIVPGKQGRPGHPDSHFIAPDYNHDGAFRLTALDIADEAQFIDEFEDGRAAGEVWFFNWLTSPTPYCDMDAGVESDGIARMNCTTVRIDSMDWRMDSGITLE
jgi:phage tail-like protein